MSSILDSTKTAIALRIARAALGWSQEEVATKAGIAKSTLARIETMDTSASATVLTALLRLYHDSGVKMDFIYGEEITVLVQEKVIQSAAGRFELNQSRKISVGGGPSEAEPRRRGRPKKNPDPPIKQLDPKDDPRYGMAA